MRTFMIGCAAALLAACSTYPAHVVVDRRMTGTPHEEGRVAEAIVGLPSSASFFYDIGLSGFVSEGPIDLAVIREYCRPYKVVSVTDQSVPLVGMMTVMMYEPRHIQVTCAGGRR